jgi:uncharacterized membrane protein YdjX (TVP38/TMEM64 family)
VAETGNQRQDAGFGARNRNLKRFLPLIAVAMLAALIFGMGWHRALTLETLVRHRAALQSFIDAHSLLAPASFIAIYIAVVALSIPGATVLSITSGFLFGTLIGGLCAATGATLGSIILFVAARTAFAEILARKASHLLGRFAEGFREDAFNYLLFLRLVPIFPFWLVNLAPALLGVRLSSFVAATAIGVIPGAFAFAFFGSGLDSVLAVQEETFMACVKAGDAGCKLDFDIKAALTPKLFVAFLVLGLMALVPVLVKRLRARRAN